MNKSLPARPRPWGERIATIADRHGYALSQQG